MVFDGLVAMGFAEVKTFDDAKMVIKALFCKRSIVNHDTGETIEIIKDTSALTKAEFNELIENVIKWGSEYLGIQIPFPNEQIDLWNVEHANNQSK